MLTAVSGLEFTTCSHQEMLDAMSGPSASGQAQAAGQAHESWM